MTTTQRQRGVDTLDAPTDALDVPRVTAFAARIARATDAGYTAPPPDTASPSRAGSV